jgi:hypothetical protein
VICFGEPEVMVLMESHDQKWVPKVHPANRPVEPEDPMTLHATAGPGDPEIMLQCLAQEYAWMGWNAGQILQLFRDPFYPALNDLLRRYGEDGIRERLVGVLDSMGIFCCQATVNDESGSAEAEPDLIELGIRTPGQPEGSDHGEGL